MRIGLVGTYPPRACGLATFTSDLAVALRGAGHRVDVVALVDGDDDPTAPDVAHRLRRHDPVASRAVAERLSDTVDVVLVQHEFGIFGGRDGELLGELTDGLRVPYALTMHTVLGQYTATQRAALLRPISRASAVLVFTDEAADLLAAAMPELRAPRHVVAHGAPAELYGVTADRGVRRRAGLPEDARVMTTFGLLSSGKGIEHAIDAVAELRNAVDDAVYVVAGRTHPGVVQQEGERYRERLEAQVRRLGLGDVVIFRDWFHEVDELARLLAATDVFVTPYANAEQIVSGALSFAVAAGVPFVSTPYRYAKELAGRGGGVIVPFADADALALALKEVLTDDDVRRRLASGARHIGQNMSWSAVGERTAAVLASMV